MTPPGYHSTDDFDAAVAAAAERGGSRVVLDEIGRSVLGRPLVAVTVAPPGHCPDPDRPQALIYAGMHGVEVIATELALALMDALVADPLPAGAAAALAAGDVTIIPCGNPDGRDASMTSVTTDPRSGLPVGRRLRYPAPRRNANKVDLNRNFPPPEGVVDSWLPLSGTGLPFLPWFRGRHPLSEPEAAAFARVCRRLRPAVLLNLHSTGRIVTYPWSAKPEPPADLERFLAVVAAFTAAQSSPYRSKQSRAWYPIIGSSNDWVHETFGTLAFTVETSAPGESVKRNPRLARWDFWFANPTDPAVHIANDLPACLAALAEGMHP